ncbi:MAG: hypothetical protein JW800_07020 [Candidatus Omnitrophica bacterium]|nr:hypothetical protein [Candidatus Omnitrophota bacterium]
MRDKGMALITVLIITLLLFGIAGSFLLLGTRARYLNERYYDNLVALSLAEAGIDFAMQEINYGGCDFSGWTDVAGVKRFTVNDFNDGAGTVYGTIVIDVHNPSSKPEIYATGSVSTPSGPAISRTVQAILKEHKLFQYAMLTELGITLNGTPSVDSYDSSIGDYNEVVDGVNNLSQNGDIVTNAEADPSIKLIGTVDLYGDAVTGPDGTVLIDGASSMTGAIDNGADEFIPPVQVPLDCQNAALGSAITADITIDSSLVGQYHKFPSISIATTDTVTLIGDLDIYITGDITSTAQSQIIITSGSTVNIYFDGNVDLSGKGVINQDSSPSTLTFYGTSSTNINLAGIGEFYGTFYAPNATLFSITGNSEIFGAVVAKDISHSGTAGFHYDEYLKENGPTLGFDVLGWNEL